MTPEIKFEQFERDCGANETIRKEGKPSRFLIRDFRVLINGEHRATLVKHRYGGRGYELRDLAYRAIGKTDSRYDYGINIPRQDEFLSTILTHLALIPTLEEIEAYRAAERVKQERRKREEHERHVREAKESAGPQLYDALADLLKDVETFSIYPSAGLTRKIAAARAAIALAEKLPSRKED